MGASPVPRLALPSFVQHLNRAAFAEPQDHTRTAMSDCPQSLPKLATTPSVSCTPERPPVTTTFDKTSATRLQALAGRPIVGAQSPRLASVSQRTLAYNASGQFEGLEARVRSSGPHVRDVLRDLYIRLNVIESNSFSHTCIEDFQDRFEDIDLHMSDLLAKYEELEGLYLLAKGDNASELSRPQYQYLEERVDLFDGRLAHLERTGPPSRTNPWQLEVILLPWARELRGIWISIEHADTSAISKLSTQRSTQDWDRGASGWLVPRACGPAAGLSGVVYERLHSRGFVQSIFLSSTSARELREALTRTFASLVGNMKYPDTINRETSRPGPACTPSGSNAYLGLQVQFMPLRKIHKSSRLQFLSPAELSAPTLWTSDFLDASAFMKVPSAGLRRLFITEPSAYLQAQCSISGSSDWSWQKLRELPRVWPNKDVSAVPSICEADALEQCWEWNCRLDPPCNAETSFPSPGSNNYAQWRPPPPQQQGKAKLINVPDNTVTSRIHDTGIDTGIEAWHCPVKPPSGVSTKHALTHGRDSQRASKRRRFSIPVLTSATPLTPRWSNEPSSPNVQTEFPDYSSGALRAPQRESTDPVELGLGPAFAYATPHSNTARLREEVDAGSATDQDSYASFDAPKPAVNAQGHIEGDDWPGGDDQSTERDADINENTDDDDNDN